MKNTWNNTISNQNGLSLKFRRPHCPSPPPQYPTGRSPTYIHYHQFLLDVEPEIHLQKISHSFLKEFYGIRRHKKEFGRSLFNKMAKICIQIPIDYRPNTSMFIEQFMKVYWPNSIHWPESIKPVTFEQVDVLIENNDKKRYEDSANHDIGEYLEIDQSMQKNMDSFENACQNQQLEEEEDGYVHTQREDSIAESECRIFNKDFIEF